VHEKDAVTEFIEREERRRQNEEKAKEPKALKREAWMLVPPSASDLLGSKISPFFWMVLFLKKFNTDSIFQ